MEKQRWYVAIDLKSFYASVECADRQLDPLTTCLVVADRSRTEKTICLAVSPALKAYGLPGRARLFEVMAKLQDVNAQRLQRALRGGYVLRQGGAPVLLGESFDSQALDADPSLAVECIIAPPRMARYMEVSAKVYGIYLRYISREDIHTYSVDEVFMDVTDYLATYRMDAHALTVTILRDILYETGLTATAGIGTNLYLAKVAMDIVAKHSQPDKDGVRIATLTEETYRGLLWAHQPLTDFWRIGHGTAKKLQSRLITTMGDLARASLYDQSWFYKTFGIDAELLIDHAWGIETTRMTDIKHYKAQSTSISEGQVLTCPYPYDQARIIVQEMAESIVLQLTAKHCVTNQVALAIDYDRENVDAGHYMGPVSIDHYGRKLPQPTHGSVRFSPATNLGSRIIAATAALFDDIINPALLVRRITISAGGLAETHDELQLDIFATTQAQVDEANLQETLLNIKQRFGKNAILRATSYMDGATMRDRNGQIGGHKA